MPLMLMAHDNDPAQELLDKVGDLSGIEIFNNQILVAVYIRPEKTKSGIYLGDNTRDEDRYQGKIGLLIKKGPDAFKPDGKWFTEDQSFEVGDWLMFRPSDTWQVTIGKEKVLCRMMDDIAVRGKVSGPDVAW